MLLSIFIIVRMYFTVKCNQIILDERHLSAQKRVVSEQKQV